MSDEHDSDPLIAPRGGDEPPAAGSGFASEDTGPAAPARDESADAGSASSESVIAPREEPYVPRTERERESQRRESANMLPQRERQRSPVERTVVRLIATGGIIGIGTAIAAIMSSSGSQGWIIGIVVSVVSVVLAALLWSSRVL